MPNFISHDSVQNMINLDLVIRIEGLHITLQNGAIRGMIDFHHSKGEKSRWNFESKEEAAAEFRKIREQIAVNLERE